MVRLRLKQVLRMTLRTTLSLPETGIPDPLPFRAVNRRRLCCMLE
jgi:hypothetical protein